MKLLTQILCCFALLITSEAEVHAERRPDLTIVEHPFLIGEWYYIPNRFSESQDPKAIRLLLTSDNQFMFQVLKPDDTTEHWQGNYTVTSDTLELNYGGASSQTYQFSNSHNQLMLDGVVFFKVLSPNIPGIWYSQEVSGRDMAGLPPAELTLVLQPDFVFMFKASDKEGHSIVESGVYYVENDRLVLFYSHGGADTQFSLKSDQLRWNFDDGAMLAVMTRLQ